MRNDPPLSGRKAGDLNAITEVFFQIDKPPGTGYNVTK